MSHYELTLVEEFAAAHQLRMYDGRLEPLHGHNWRIEVTLEAGKLDAIGVVADFTVLRHHLHASVAELNDTFLNELPAFRETNPTTEHVARHLAQRLSPHLPDGVTISRVRVWETAGCAAAYVPGYGGA